VVVGMNLRQAAAGQPCSMCGANNGTTILHHIRLLSSGMGTKPPDHHGVNLCATCHAYVHGDGITDTTALLRAYMRQIDKWLADEIMVVQ